MARNSARQMIEDEKKIIQELYTNANKSVNEIAKNCGFSRQKVWRIIKNLEKNNIIWGYTVVIDETKQDLKSYIVLLKRTNLPIDKTIIEKITKRELVNKANKLGIRLTTSVYTNGIYDWIICFNAMDIRDAKRFVEELNRIFKGYLDEIQLLEEMFVVQKSAIQNPEVDKLKDFFGEL